MSNPDAPPEPRRPEHAPEPLPEPSLVPVRGWHVLHLYYRVNRSAQHASSAALRGAARDQFVAALAGGGSDAARPERIQCFATVGHKADMGLMMAGPDLRALQHVQTALQTGELGTLLEPAYSFYSITEISEYVPDEQAYAQTLEKRERMDPGSSIFKTRVAQYANRLKGMNQQRLYPDFPDWPCICFYPMNKIRVAPDQNWYTTPFDERMEMMTDHGKSGMKFAGKVSQLITASTGLDDWEWGVTLWARNPVYIKDIVYAMRFDRASAQYAEFGPFYPGYILPPAELASEIRL